MLYLGVDGGGTKTKVIIINDKKEILYEGLGGPSSIDTVSIETTIKHINDAVYDFYKTHQSDIFKGVFIGLGGIATNEDILKVEKAAKDILMVNTQTIITARNDMVNALASGEHYEDGIVLICGTGMVCFGHRDGLTHKSGGWGYKSGDEGSGYFLGIEAIKVMIRAYDHRIKKTPFTEKIFQTLKVKDIYHIPSILDNLTRTDIAALAPIVREYATNGDVYALDILKRGAYELSLCVKAVYETIKPSPNIVVVGSLGNIGIYKDMIHQAIRAINPNFNIAQPIIDPALASAYLAIKHDVSKV